MRIHGTFLASRAGRRIFWTLLLAAAVPIGLFGIALHGLLSEHFESQAQRQQVQLTKFAGMNLLDRLLMARTALGIASRTGRADSDPTVLNRRGRVLVQTAHLDAQGRLVAGRADLAQRWHERVASWATAEAGDTATLMLGAMNDASGAREVLMALRRVDRPGEVWLGEIDTAFLFGELAAQDSGARICVLTSNALTVFCPGESDQSSLGGQGAAGDAPRPSWNLFLRSDFGIDDWTLMNMDGTPADAPGMLPLARLSALGAVATLLFVGMLSLIQVRRTMGPLERLAAGTRRLAERDYAARVDVAHDDEFGELARSFNHMAERIDHQVQAMQVQSSIDREILNGLNVARVLQRVALRLEELMPGATACVVEFDRARHTLARAHWARAPLALVNLPRAELARAARLTAPRAGPARPAARGGSSKVAEPHLPECADGGIWTGTVPVWLAHVLPRPAARVTLNAARSGGDLFGLLVIASDGAPQPDGDVQREVRELCDRVSVTLASADRERRLLERATQDSLTGLANRLGLVESIESRLAYVGAEPFTVMFIDLDRFKEVNDSMGHHVGDELLRVVAGRLRGCVPQGTLVARPGGDEFVLVVQGPRTVAEALAPRLCTVLSQPVPLAERALAAGASIGMAHHPEHGRSLSDLMRRADMAMYSAKARGGGIAAWFEPALDARTAERAALRADLDQALVSGQFTLQYQPRVDAHSAALVGAEALLRWRHPVRGQVPVPVFIELLEETGAIHAVGLWAIEQAARQLAAWRSSGMALDSVAVNLSTRQLQSAELPDQVAAILARHGLAPANLELEVTESIFMGDSAAAIGVLQRLHDSGIRIALDDFGTGYSSLSYLHKLPIAVLKVDRSFVCELGERDSALALTRSIVALARSLGLRVVAEGVEQERQAALLRELGCDELQGYLFARPLEPDAFGAFAYGRHAQDADATVPV